MTSINSLIESINQGALLIKNRRYDEAMRILNYAFEFSKEVLRQKVSSPTTKQPSINMALAAKATAVARTANTSTPATWNASVDVSGLRRQEAQSDEIPSTCPNQKFLCDCCKSTTSNDKNIIRQGSQLVNNAAQQQNYLICCHRKRMNISNQAAKNAENYHDTFVYREPISIQQDDAVEEEDDSQQSRKSRQYYFVFVVLFNLALAQHLSAIDDDKYGIQKIDPSKKKRRREKAARLYDLALALKASQSIRLNKFQSLGLINNISVLAKEIGKQEKSERMLKSLLSAILYYICFQQQDDDEKDPIAKEIQNIYQNLSCLVLIDKKLAPAA